MELGKLFFQFYGYFSEGMDFHDDTGKRVLMLKYDYLGGSVTLPVTPDEYASAPEEGTLVRVVGLIKVDKSKGRITLKPLEILSERDKDFKTPTQAELMAGTLFQGDVIVSNKRAGVMDDGPYRNATVAIFGGSYKFSSLDEKIFDLFPEQGLASLSGKVDVKVVSYQKDGRTYKQCENTLLLDKVVRLNAEPKQPAKAPAA